MPSVSVGAQDLTEWSRRLKQCQNCMQGETDERPMRTCSACKRCYYCSRQCQKADWKTHKPICDYLRRNRMEMKDEFKHQVLPASGLDRFKVDVISRKWVQHFRSVLNSVTFAALELREHPERRFTHVLSITILPKFTAKTYPDTDLEIRKSFTFESARLVRWDELDLTPESRMGLKASQDKVESLRSSGRYPESIGGCLVVFVKDCNVARVVPAVFEALPHPCCFNTLIQPDWKTLVQRRIDDGEPF